MSLAASVSKKRINSGIIYVISSYTWRIIPVSKWLGSPPLLISHETAIWKRSHNLILRGLTIAMVINHVSESWDDSSKHQASLFPKNSVSEAVPQNLKP